MAKQKLLIVTDNFLPRWDGIARFLVEVIPKLSEEYNITILAPDFSGSSIHFPDVEIIRFKLSPFNVNDYPLAYPSRLVEKYVEESDIVWVQTIAPLCACGIYYAKKLNKPLVAFVHSIDWELSERSIPGPFPVKYMAGVIVKKLAQWLYNKCDILMVPTKEVADIFENVKITSSKILVPLGVNTNKFKPAKDKEEIKKSLGIKPEEIVIGYCGRVTRDKDLMTLYKAFEWLEKRFNNLKLLIVGPGIPEYISHFESKPNVIVTGAKDDVVPYYQAMDIYVLPSLTETTSLSTLEAMSSGLAIVSTKVGVVQDLIKNNENGFFFPKKNVLVLKKKLLSLIRNKETRDMFGKRIRNIVIKTYSWDKTIKGIEEVLAKF